MKSRHAAQSAELGDVTGYGYLAVVDDGFRRCEGIFRCRLVDRPQVIAMMQEFPLFRGIVYDKRGDIGRRSVDVAIRAFRSQHDGVIVDVRAVGEWWQALDSVGRASR